MSATVVVDPLRPAELRLNAGLSVVIASYRRPAGLDRLLTQLREQVEGRSERQLIVVNDASHDEAYAQVIERHRGYVDYVVAPRNGGPAAARNLGARHARHEFLVFVDDDCAPPPYWLDWLAANIAENRDVDVFGGTTRPLPAKKYGFFESFLADSGYHPQPSIKKSQVVQLVTANLAVRRRLFEELGGFNPSLRTAEDRNLTYRLRIRRAIFHVDTSWYVYHSMTSSVGHHFRRHYHYGRGNHRQIRLEETSIDLSFWPAETRSLKSGWRRIRLAFQRARGHTKYPRCSWPRRWLFTALSASTLLAMDLGYAHSQDEARKLLKKSSPPKPRRVAYISPASNLFGAERSLLETLRCLDRTRYEPTLVIVHEGALEEAARALDVPVVRMHRLKEDLVNGFFGKAAAVLLFSRWLIVSRIDVVELNYVGTPCLFIPLLAARLTGRAFVFRNRYQEPRFTNLEKRLLRRRSLILPTTRGSVSHWFDGSLPDWWRQKLANDLHILPVSRNMDKLKRAIRDRTLVRELGVPDNAPIVGMVASIDPNKRQDLFIKAAAQIRKKHPDVWFVVCGEPYWRHGGAITDYEVSLSNLTKELGLEDRVVFTGYRSDALSLLKNFDVMVLASQKESFGGVLIEAMCLGIPIVAASVGGVPEALGEGKGGILVNGDSPDAYAAAISHLLGHSEQAEKLRQSALEWVRRYDSAVVTRQLEDCYDGLLSGEH